MPKTKTDKTPFERMTSLTRRIVSVPRAELPKRKKSRRKAKRP